MVGFFHPLALLLRGEGYPAAVSVALVLHLGVAWFLIDRNFTSTYVKVEEPQFIAAATIAENPQQIAAQQAKQVYEQELARQRAAEAEQRRRQEQQRQEQQRQEQARAQEQERQRQEAERQRQAKAEEQRRQEQAQREQAAKEQAAREQAAKEQAAREQAAREEAARQAQQQAEAKAQAEAQAAADASSVQSYTGIIRQRVAELWSRPPSARNGMEVLLRIQLIPTGEVVDVTVLRSSGDPAFDRSAVLAVEKADRFPELQGMNIRLFEKEFRTINLLFKPEDLLR